jgi:hypothetical protein
MPDKKKPSWQTVEDYQNEKLNDRTAAAIKELKKITKEKKDPYLERNEFKPGFYDQPDKRPVTAETMYGTGTTRQLDESIMSPDDSMLVEYRKGGGLIAKGCGKVMKDRKKVTKMY